MLRALVTGDDRARAAAWLDLYDELCHQGQVWEATAHVVPFLVALLEVEVPNKEHVVDCLRRLAWSFYYRPREESDGDMRTWANASHEAVARHVDVFLRRLTAADQAERVALPYLLSKLPECAEYVLPSLRAALASEADEPAAASLVRAIGALADDPSTGSWLDGLVRDDPRPLVRLSAAVARVLGDGFDEQVVLPLLAEAIEEPARFADLPWGMEKPGHPRLVDADVSAVVAARLGPSAAPFMISPLLAAVARSSARSAVSHVAALLRVLFGPPTRQPRASWKARAAGELTEQQRAVLATLAAKRDLWFVETRHPVTGQTLEASFSNMKDPFRDHALPSHPERLQAYLAEVG